MLISKQKRRQILSGERRVRLPTGYDHLANAIIKQASYDYVAVLKSLDRKPNDSTAINRKKEIERFFRGSWYKFLTDVDPEYLIERLKTERPVKMREKNDDTDDT